MTPYLTPVCHDLILCAVPEHTNHAINAMINQIYAVTNKILCNDKNSI